MPPIKVCKSPCFLVCHFESDFSMADPSVIFTFFCTVLRNTSEYSQTLLMSGKEPVQCHVLRQSILPFFLDEVWGILSS